MSQSDLMILRGLIQKAGWGEFMGNVSGLMAEQADKVKRDSKEETSLVSCHRTLGALQSFFNDCGKFSYTEFAGFFSPEDLEIIRKFAS